MPPGLQENMIGLFMYGLWGVLEASQREKTQRDGKGLPYKLYDVQTLP